MFSALHFYARKAVALAHMKHLGLFISVGIIFLSQGIYSQEKELMSKDMSLYVHMARHDAQLEQDLQFISEDDEADFWQDQKNFENALKQRDYSAYKVYLMTKQEAYAEHELLCKVNCKHGIYFHAQASSYKRNAIFGYVQNTKVATTPKVIISGPGRKFE
jgi:hypothetical protein